jgi:hypothetical protein
LHRILVVRLQFFCKSAIIKHTVEKTYTPSAPE